MPKRKREPQTMKNKDALEKLLKEWKEDNSELDTLDLSAQLNSLKVWVDKANEAITYVKVNEVTLRGKFGLMSIRQVLTELEDLLDEIKRVGAGREALADKRAKFENSVVTRRSGEHAGDGNCYVTFINVGMGDCTIVTTPKGKRILIDCGSSSLSDVILDPDWDASTHPSAEGYIRLPFLDDRFLNGGDSIDILFLTHPDEDHHNKLKEILEPMDIKAGIVYFGGAATIEAYTSSAYIKEISSAEDNLIRRIVLCEEDELEEDKVIITNTINGRELGNAGTPDTLGDEFVDPDTNATVIYQEENEDDNSIDFEISVLAANVTGIWNDDNSTFVVDDTAIKKAGEMKRDGTSQNKGSLIVLIYCFQEYVLVCGDATAVTEQFAVKHFSSLLEKVDHLRLGHHGSPTSSSKRFLRTMKYKRTAEVSTGGKETRLHQLPKTRIIELVAGMVNDGAPLHDIYSFDLGDQLAKAYLENSAKLLWATGSNGSRTITIKPTA